jgi:dTDP-4-dehydrorhamnose reductase
MIIVTGCNPLARGLVSALGGVLAKGEVAIGACDSSNPEMPGGFLTYDVLSEESITQLVSKQRPKALVLTEEIDSLEYCEHERMDAMQYNTRSVRFFTEAARKHNARVVYRSTAFVFDGRKPGGLYTETDKVNPLNVYGETKLMGEVYTDKVPEFLIVRVGELYGAFPGNFASHVSDSLRYGEKVELARDMYFSPIYVDDAVRAIRELVVNDMAGFFNVAGPERVSHFEFGARVAKALGLNADLIVPMSADEMGLTVPMPRDTSLDTAKLSALLKVRGADEGLAAMKAAAAGTK